MIDKEVEEYFSIHPITFSDGTVGTMLMAPSPPEWDARESPLCNSTEWVGLDLGNSPTYNHTRPLEDFREAIDIIQAAGFELLAVSQLYFEDTFIFATEEEALRAFGALEMGSKQLYGWWYGLDQFMQAVGEYEADGDYKVLTHWLIDNSPD